MLGLMMDVGRISPEILRFQGGNQNHVVLSTIEFNKR